MKEIIWLVDRGHPIAEDLDDEKIILEKEEIYGEPFSVPTPDETVFISWFECGAVFRSGLCYKRGKGKIFYFQPGHETNPTYLNPTVGLILRNAVHWTAPEVIKEELDCPWELDYIEKKYEK